MTSLATEAWSRDRGRLLGIAYRMLGDFGEAEDVVSEVAISALNAERDGVAVRSWPGWLVTTCVRRSVDRVRSLAASREMYPGPWLPEPVATERLPEDVVATREMLSLALLHLAQQLEPTARAAVVLHRAYGMTAPEIGDILDRSPAAVRQLISRAERRLNLRADGQVPEPADPAALAQLVAAIESGDVERVVAFLHDDVVLVSDGGGKVSAARKPIRGSDAVARFLIGVVDKARRAGDAIEYGVTPINAGIALDAHRRGGQGRRDVAVATLHDDGRIVLICQVSNPDKLTRV